MAHIARLVNHLLKVLVRVARLVLTQVKEILTKPNVKSNYVVWLDNKKNYIISLVKYIRNKQYEEVPYGYQKISPVELV